MGILPSRTKSESKDSIKLWYLNKDTFYDVNLTEKLQKLYSLLDDDRDDKTQPLQIFYSWAPVSEKDQDRSLDEIIRELKKKCLDNLKIDQDFCCFVAIQTEARTVEEATDKEFRKLVQDTRFNKILRKFGAISQGYRMSMSPSISVDKQDRLCPENKEGALIASTVKYALLNSKINPQQIDQLERMIREQENNQNIEKKGEQQRDPIQQKQEQKGNQSSEKRMFYMSSLQGPKREMTLLQKLVKIVEFFHNNTEFKLNPLKRIEAVKTLAKFSNFDFNFLHYLRIVHEVYRQKGLEYPHYILYKKIDDFDIAKIPANSKIGIIGDYGTGLHDSIELMTNMIVKHGVNVILHLGDAYYAGTPEEYRQGIADPLSKLRLETKREIRFYSIPGNHDYYSWGLPFLCFVKSINEQKFQQQKASYFCIRDQLDRWQFMGLDSSFYDASPASSQIPSMAAGPSIRTDEMRWHQHRIRNFKGSTVLLSHHQLFSICEKINGNKTKFKKFSCFNPLMYAQLFEHLGDVSAWFWGHEHSFMLFKDNLFGVSKSRLVGNSSFHVINEIDTPYDRPKDFPFIPFITEDQKYEKYIPKNPHNVKNKDKDEYYHLTYAVIDLEQIDKQNNVPIVYYCSPCYNEDEYKRFPQMKDTDKKKITFDEYILYEEQLLSIETLRKAKGRLKSGDKVYLRSEIGMAINAKQRLQLKLEGSQWKVILLDEKKEEKWTEANCYLKLVQENQQTVKLLGVSKDDKVELMQFGKQLPESQYPCVWTLTNYLENSLSEILSSSSIKIYHKVLQKFLTYSMNSGSDQICLDLEERQFSSKQEEIQRTLKGEESKECLWMIERESGVRQ